MSAITPPIGSLARKVIGLGEQTEPADRAVDKVTVTYVEKLDDGSWTIELSDGSQWRLPARPTAVMDARTRTAAVYDDLAGWRP